MAKGSFLGVKRGKLGDAVGYNVTNSNDKDKQGWRVYQPVVANPQSDGQIDQRVKLAAANNLYRALKPIIQRGWENHKYGDESRRAFLKKALGASFVGPYLEKGSTLAVPIEGVPITYGSLTPVVTVCGSNEVLLANVPYDGEVFDDTIGSLSTLFISAGLAQEGDQVTFILASLNGAGSVSYLTKSFYVDTGNTDTTQNVLGMSFSSDTYDGTEVTTIDIATITDFSLTHFAAMTSISRDGEGANLRSYAEFDMTSEFRSFFYGNSSQVERAKASYRKKMSSSTNWPLNPDSDVVLPVGTAHAMVNSATPAQVQVNAYRMQGGYLQVFDNTNAIWRYVYCVDVRLSQYHMWLTSNMLTSSMWSGTAPTGAVATDAVRMQSGSDATAVDLEFDAWLVDNGYNARFIYGNIPG